MMRKTLLLLLALALATPSNAQFIMVSGGQGAVPDPGGSGDPFDLDQYPDITCPIVWPTAPNTTSSQTVTPGNIASHINATKHLTLSSGSYGNLSITGDDQRFTLQSGAVVGLFTFGSGVDRIIIESENPRDGEIQAIIAGNTLNNAADDVLIDGVTINADAAWGSHNGGSVGFYVYDGARWAIVNSHVTSVDYSIYNFSGSAGGGTDNFIVANNNFIANTEGHASGVRFGSVENLVYVANRLETVRVGNQFRLHSAWSPTAGQNITCAYAAENQIEASLVGYTSGYTGTNSIEPFANPGDDPATMSGVVFENNKLYKNGGDGAVNPGPGPTPPDYPTSLIIRNNDSYGGAIWPTQALPYVTVSGNTTNSYTTPPVWNFQ